MNEFVAGLTGLANWIGSPDAYNWITLMGAGAAIMTAAFTGYSASAQWRDRKKRVSAEWAVRMEDSCVLVTCFVKNKTDGTLVAETATVKGLNASLEQQGGHAKHESWAKSAVGVLTDVSQDQSATITFIVQPEPEKLRIAAAGYSARSMLVLTKLLWRSLQWRFRSGPKFSITLTLRRRSSEMRPIRLTHTIRIYPDMAMKMAANIEASADKA